MRSILNTPEVCPGPAGRRPECDSYQAKAARPGRLLRFAAVAALCAAQLPGGDQAPGKKKTAGAAPAGAPASDLIWPLPPDPPRIRWIAQYQDLAKVKNPAQKKAGWVEKLTGSKTPEERLEMRKPYGVATDKRGRIYAADTELKAVFIIDAKAKSVEKRQAGARSPMVLPVGVALDGDDRLFVSDAALHSILCYSASGQPLAFFGTAQLARPGGIAIDRGRNRLYVADAKDSRIAVFDTTSFQFAGYFGAPDAPGKKSDGRFLNPTNLAVDRKGNIYVADTGNYRVQVLDAAGKFVRSFGTQGDAPGEFIRPKGIALDSEGHVYVADAEFNNFQIFSPEGQPLLAVGTLGADPGQFALVAGLSIDSEDRIYTTEMYQGRIQVFQYLARPGAPEEKVAPRSASR